jgi:SAM-dependent methyltransferase
MSDIFSPPSQAEYWNEWHHTNQVRESGPNRHELVDVFLEHLPATRPCSVLDLGCGPGRDSLHFGLAGMDVHALDFSHVALSRARRTMVQHPDICVRLLEHDISNPLPFPDGYFAGIYSHLSLHYFDDLVTQRIFGEILRTANVGCIFGFSVKSTSDSYYGQGTLIECDMFRRKGHIRHFFSEDYTRFLLRDWKILILDQYTGHYANGDLSSFIRVIAMKP